MFRQVSEKVAAFNEELTALLNKYFAEGLKYGGYIERGPQIGASLVRESDYVFINVHVDAINFRIPGED